MGTTVRSEVSKKNMYWLDRHRYYELKHFCLQYPDWEKAYRSLDGYCAKAGGIVDAQRRTGVSDPTAMYVEARLYYGERIQMVKDAAETDGVFGGYILRAVTEGLSYEHLKARGGIPCCRETYYEMYRRFFWLLDKARK